MRKHVLAFFFAIFTFIYSYADIPNQTIAPMLANVTPTVVNIFVKKEVSIPDFFTDQETNHPPKLKGVGIGSGVIINAKQGLIITNSHVVKDEKLIVVTLKNGQRYHAHLIAKDDDFDLAIIQIHAEHLKQIQFADSDHLKVGDFVAAIGSPFGLTQTVTSGMVSALDRDEPKLENAQSFIQTDAPINPGNSGGALVNAEGKLIGINTAILSTSGGNLGIGFAIPSNVVSAVAKQLLKYGNVKQGMLGVIVQTLNPSLATGLNIDASKGVVVSKVVTDSPAAKAGLKLKDVILSVNHKLIHNAEQLKNVTSLMRPGTKITLELLRNNKKISRNATIGDPAKFTQSTQPSLLTGLTLQAYDQLLPDGTDVQGLAVTSVKDSSEAALAGLTSGDVILTANGQQVDSIKTLQNIAKTSKQLVIYAARGSSRFYVVIQSPAN